MNVPLVHDHALLREGVALMPRVIDAVMQVLRREQSHRGGVRGAQAGHTVFLNPR